jgi:hypothetical protein
MHAAQDLRLKAERYAELARGAKSPRERDLFLRLTRSYGLIARCADFDTALGDVIARLKT